MSTGNRYFQYLLFSSKLCWSCRNAFQTCSVFAFQKCRETVVNPLVRSRDCQWCLQCSRAPAAAIGKAARRCSSSVARRGAAGAFTHGTGPEPVHCAWWTGCPVTSPGGRLPGPHLGDSGSFPAVFHTEAE